MRLNADFSRRAIVTPEQYQWVASPQSGVERVMLDRVGEEKARATSIVRYAPGSWFPQHPHPGGEEILGAVEAARLEVETLLLPARQRPAVPH